MTTRFPNRFVVSVAIAVVLALLADGLLTRARSFAAEPEKPKSGKQETVLLFEPVVKGELAKVDSAKLVATLRRRVDPSGVLGVKIRVNGANQIEIKVPQVVDQEQLDRIERTFADVGTLEFRILATDQRTSSPNFKTMIQRAKALPNDQTRLFEEKKGDEPPLLLAKWVPVAEGREPEFRAPPFAKHFATRELTDSKGHKQLQVLVYQDPWNVTGEYLTRAAPGADRVGRPSILFTFNSAGAAKFGRLTGDYSPDRVQQIWYHLGIILDGKLITAPRINSPISDRGEITGGFTEERVKELVDVLNAGALPVALKRVSP